MNAELRPDVEEIKRTMQLFVAPEGIGEIRIIRPGKSNQAQSGFFFRHDQIDDAAKQAADLDKLAKGIYIVMNEINRAVLNGRDFLIMYPSLTKDVDIARRRWLLIDCDPKSPNRASETSATDDEKSACYEIRNAICQHLYEFGFPEPIYCDSGNGKHMLYQIDMAADEESHQIVKSVLGSLAKRFNSTDMSVDIAVHNASRITKLYGSIARKGEHCLDRPHRLSQIEFIPDNGPLVVACERLIAVAHGRSQASSLNSNDDRSIENSSKQANGACEQSRDDFMPTKGKLILPETIEEGQRHFNFVALAGAVRSIGAHETEIFEVLRVFNQTRCPIGSPDEELQRIAKDFANKDCNLSMKALMESDSDEKLEAAERAQRFKCAIEHATKKLQRGDDFAEIVAKLHSTTGQLIGQGEPHTFKTMTSAELDLADLRIEYLVDDVLALHQPCIVAASKKSLKTTIGIDLTLSLASGAKFLDKFNVPRSVRVALMSGESGDATIQETARRIARTKPWSKLSAYQNAIWSFELPKLGQLNTRRDLTNFITDHALEVLIIDPAYLCLELGDQAGNLFSVGGKLNEISEVGRETGCTIIIVHHNRKVTKENPFAPPELESIAWSGFQEWARQWILLGRREAYNPELAGSHKLWLSVGGSAGHSGQWAVDVEEGSRSDEGGRQWAVTLKGASSAIEETKEEREQIKTDRDAKKKQSRAEADAVKLLEVYKGTPMGETTKALRALSGFNDTRFPPANAILLEKGLIETCSVEKSKRKYEGFRLSSQESNCSGTSGTERDSTGTAPLVPVGASSGTVSPIRGQSARATDPIPLGSGENPPASPKQETARREIPM